MEPYETEPYGLVPVDNQTLDGGVLPPGPDFLPSGPGVLPPDPSVLPTCLRGCLCGYSAPYGQYSDDIYSYCDCKGSLAILFFYLSLVRIEDYPAQTLNAPPVYTTPTNLSLLLQYSVGVDEFNSSIVETYS